MKVLFRSALVIAVTVFTTGAGTTPTSQFKGITYSKPPDGTGSDTATVAKITNELARPCDKMEAVFWNSDNPSADVAALSATTTVGLLKAYSVTDQTAASPIAQKAKATALGADETGGSGRLTLAWTMATNTVTLGVCGDKSSIVTADQPPTKSEIKVKPPPPPTQVSGDWKPTPGSPSTGVLSLQKQIELLGTQIQNLNKQVEALDAKVK
jgi:hypothetical protein